MVETEDGGTFTINDRDVVEVKDYLGKRYICLKFERTGKDGKIYVNRMNFDQDSWTKLISDVMEPPKTPKKAVKRRKTGDAQKCKKRLLDDIPIIPTITQYSWTYDNQQGPCWYFTEALCRQSADFVEDQNEITVNTRQVPTPSMDDVATMITTYLVMGEMRRLMNQNCFGCLVDHPSQIQHMDNGCMMEWEAAVEQYYEQAAQLVQLDDVRGATIKVMDVLQLPVAADAITQIPAVRKDVNEMNIMIDYELLFRDVLC